MNELQEKIIALKKERGALILAHYYVSYDIQQIADFVGDSFELSKRAKTAAEDIIVFCGVSFMGESAKILAPEKTVLLPSADAGCPMADMVTKADITALREKYPDAAVVCYVNSSAETKSAVDICCTSSNALRVVRSLPNERVIFVPDKNLGAYIASQVPEKEFIFFSGYCPIHNALTVSDVLAAKEKHPAARFVAHPECTGEVLALADFIGSTSQIIDCVVKGGENDEFIIGTENGVIERLARLYPEKKIFPVTPSFVCENMKKTTLQDVLDSLLYNKNEVVLPENIMNGARASLEKMISV